MIVENLDFYNPADGHGLPHDPFNGIIGPRPIGWISSQDQQGDLNLAPYSVFNAFICCPHILGFSSTSWKDSVSIIEEPVNSFGISLPWISRGYECDGYERPPRS
jgi:flavin reductase (DIM6/NTAB) family NADH-FMN oxidoreductase RutF